MYAPEEGQLINLLVRLPADVEDVCVIIYIGCTQSDFRAAGFAVQEGAFDADVQPMIIGHLSAVEVIQHDAQRFVNRADVCAQVDVGYVRIKCSGLGEREAGTVVPSEVSLPASVQSPTVGRGDVDVVPTVEMGAVHEGTVIALDPVERVYHPYVQIFVIVFEGNVSTIGTTGFYQEFIIILKHLVTVDVGQLGEILVVGFNIGNYIFEQIKFHSSHQMLSFLQTVPQAVSVQFHGFRNGEESVEQVHYVLIGSGSDEVLGI